MPRHKHPDDISENDVKKAIQYYLKKKGIFHWKHWSGGKYARKDVSDILGIYPVRVQDLVDAGIDEVGIFMGIELKRPKKKPTEDQATWGDKVKDAGGIWFWADCKETVIKAFSLAGMKKLLRKGDKR